MFVLSEVEIVVETDILDTIIRKCKIIKRFAPLDDSILGYYYCDGRYDIILINESIQDNDRVYRCVLAEEIGHYRMTIGDTTPRKFMCYRDRLALDKQELLALRWAVDFLIPSKTILEAMEKQSLHSICDLENYFMVTREFLMQKLEFMSKENPLWRIDNRRSMCLYHLPSIFIFDKPEDI
jgi:Zn-dependent peptidase ImmA (M78 family)